MMTEREKLIEMTQDAEKVLEERKKKGNEG